MCVGLCSVLCHHDLRRMQGTAWTKTGRNKLGLDCLLKQIEEVVDRGVSAKMKSIFDNPTSPQDNTFTYLAMLGPLGAKPLLCPFWQGQHRHSTASAPIYWHCPSPKHKWSKTLPLNINTRKAAGPDGVLGRGLKDSADELAEVFTTIYNMSLSTLWVPGCFKAATIVPVP